MLIFFFKSRDGPRDVLFLISLLLASSLLAQNVDLMSCIGGCASTTCPTGSQCHDACISRCERTYGENPKPFGAIAYGTDHGAEGISWGKQTQQEADQNALSTCARYGNNCKIVYRFKYTCAALAVTPDRQHCDAATGFSEQDAEANAVSVCQHDWGKCLTNMSACSLQGAGPAFPPTPPKAIAWGAIAYSSSDMGAGFAFGKNDQATAQKEALAACAQRGKNCVLETAFNKQCGALAADRNFTGWGVAPDQRVAQQRAIEECAKAGGSRCVLHISFCSK